MHKIGIYMLSFDNYNLVYIGQSINIDNRVANHLSGLKTGRHYNYKMLEAYAKYGEPIVDILELCGPEELNNKENWYIKEFNSCLSGLNIRDEEENILRGPNANSAVYTKEQILSVFYLLCDKTNSSKYIESLTGVPVGNINMIARGASHSWLMQEDPEKYTYMLSLVGSRRGIQQTLEARKGAKHPTLISPDGIEYSNIGNLSQFCKEHWLPYTCVHKLTKGLRNSVHGWKVKKN